MDENKSDPHSQSPDYPVNKSIFDYLFILRPALHPPVWTIVILGYFRNHIRPESYSTLIWLLLISSGAAGWAYIVNQISDIETDRINRKLFFLPDGIISIKTAWVIGLVILLFTLVGAYKFGLTIGLLFSLGLILGYFYSARPIMGKDNPYLSTLFNGLAHGPIPFVAGYVGAGGEIPKGAILALPYFFAVIAVFIGTTIPDIPGDSRSGKITPGVSMGEKYAAAAMTLSLMAGLLISFVIWDIPFLIVADLCLPFYLYGALKPGAKNAVLAIKISILLLSLAACWRFWPYTLILITLWIVTRIYYRMRFGMVYPRLT